MPYTASAKVTIISYEERQILIIFALEFNYMIQIPFRIGHGYDVHALGEGLELWLGGVRIPHTKGCIAILLQRVDALVRSHGYAVANADITIAAQRPKLAPYIVSMRQTLADILGVDISQVSVKATTTEHLGFTGREEGIAVWASVLLLQSTPDADGADGLGDVVDAEDGGAALQGC